MREVVVDASVAAKWVVEEDHSAKAALLLAYDTLYAPAHWRAEAVNVLWSKVFKGDLTAADAEDRMLTLNRAPIVEAAISDLLQRAFTVSVAHSVTIYDSLYVAFAEKRDVQMVTADVRLVRRLSAAAALRQHVTWIGDLAG